MNLHRWLIAIAVTAALSLAAVACGDDDDDDGTPTAGAETQVVLFFPKVTATDFEYIEVERTVASDAAEPEDVVALLLEGPTSGEESALGVTNPFPANVEVLSVEVSGDDATVDFSEELLDYGGGAAAVTSISESISRTVQEATGASTVVILVEGEPDRLQP